MAPNRILVVDDEERIRSLVGSYLRKEGYQVDEVPTGEEAVAAVRARAPDLVVLDVRLPGIDGLEALRQIRRISEVYVIMLTARTEETDRVIGLEVGADDYLTKPFSPRELVARIRAILRRGRRGASDGGQTLRFADLVVDPSRRGVAVDGRAVELTALEFDLLAALASAPGRVFTRRQLIERVWGWDFFGEERIVDVHIRNLRKALGDVADDPRFIGTVRGVGYKLIPEQP
ncbi:MAG TPA: response regulator transcription factor [Actinomycetota bacterium]|nr:response regulator transcription factor [Actinomycetota bacterium]